MSHLYLFLGSLAAWLIVSTAKSRARKSRLPPGPPGLPVIGNALQIPENEPWIQFAEWAKKYGPIIHLNVLGDHLIVLNHVKATNELMERRGGRYAGRPTLPMAGQIIGYDRALTLTQYDSRHKEQRKALNEIISREKVTQLHDFLESKAMEFLQTLLHDSNDLEKKIELHIARVNFRIAYGYDLTGPDDPNLEYVHKCGREFPEVAKPGRFLVDIFPLLRRIPEWMPFSPHREAKKWRVTAEQVSNMLYHELRDQPQTYDPARRSLLQKLLLDYKNPTPEEELDCRWLTATFMAAGTDSPTNVLCAFFLTMILYPQVQRKAQAEIDAVIGSGRLPSLRDKDHLPYVMALCKEIVRLYITTPIAMPHMCTEEDVYEDYYIPAGSIVISNAWAILHDPENFDKPFDFIPERYLKPSNEIINSFDHAFGYGRRTCPGKYLALDTVYITIAQILAVYNIRPPKDMQVPTWSTGLTVRPTKFNCEVTPRNPGALVLIQSS